jgi:hypothetical protein
MCRDPSLSGLTAGGIEPPGSTAKNLSLVENAAWGNRLQLLDLLDLYSTPSENTGFLHPMLRVEFPEQSPILKDQT